MLKMIFFLFLSLNVQALPIDDVDLFLNTPSFEESFKDGDVVEQLNKSCVFKNICDEYSLFIHVLQTNEQQASGEYRTVNNKKPRLFSIMRSDWEQFNGNMLRLLFARIQNLGLRPYITQLVESEFKLVNGTTYSALKVKFEVMNSSKYIVSRDEALLVPAFPGYAQLALYKQIKSNKGMSMELIKVLKVNRHLSLASK